MRIGSRSRLDDAAHPNEDEDHHATEEEEEAANCDDVHHEDAHAAEEKAAEHEVVSNSEDSVVFHLKEGGDDHADASEEVEDGIFSEFDFEEDEEEHDDTSISEEEVVINECMSESDFEDADSVHPYEEVVEYLANLSDYDDDYEEEEEDLDDYDYYYDDEDEEEGEEEEDHHDDYDYYDDDEDEEEEDDGEEEEEEEEDDEFGEASEILGTFDLQYISSKVLATIPPLGKLDALKLLRGCSAEPFKKQLTESDVKQGRLELDRNWVEGFLVPMMREEEKSAFLGDGIAVTVYDVNSRELVMKLRMVGSDSEGCPVLEAGWREFCEEQGLIAVQDTDSQLFNSEAQFYYLHQNVRSAQKLGNGTSFSS